MFKKIILCFIAVALVSVQSFGQQKDISKMTRADIMAMSYEELAELPIEDVMQLTKILGISLDEFYEMLLNKDVTSASKKAESSFESPLSTTVLSYDEIVASGARNIQEALRLVPGVIVREKTNGNYDIHIRGNNNIPDDNLTVYTENSMTLVMINSRPVYNYINGGTFWESLPVDFADIDRIEVVRGAASALYGANAVTGVINIITKTPDSEDIQVFGQVQGGNVGSYMGSLSVGQNIGKFGYRVSGNYQKMNRTTDKLYVFDNDSLMSKEDVANPNFRFKSAASSWFSVWNQNKSIDDWYKDTETAVDRLGANLSLYYNLSDDINFSLSGGYQNSYVTSSSFGDPAVSATAREMNGFYADFIAKAKGLTLQANVQKGTQDIVRGDQGFKADNTNFNLSAEYDFILGNLNVRPGIYYQYALYDDTPYLDEEPVDGKYTKGYLNGDVSIKSTAASLRVDYKALDDKLRLIGGLRAEKFNVNDDVYLPFQFVASYNLNNKHMIRGVVSRANRGPFMVESYSNYLWDREGVRPMPLKMKFSGNKEQKLANMTMFELGYRVRPVRNLLVEVEAFSTITKDFGCLLPESMTAYIHASDSMAANVNLPNVGIVHSVRQPVPAPAIPYQVNLKYQNIDVKANQYGITLNAEWVATEKLVFKVFGTYQMTKLKDHVCYNSSKIITDMTTLAAVNASQGQGVVGQGVNNYFVTPFKAGVQQKLDAGDMQKIEAGVTMQAVVKQLVEAGLPQDQAKATATQMAQAQTDEWKAAAAQVHAMAENAQIDAYGIPSAIAEQQFNAEVYDQTLQQLQGMGLVQYDGRYKKETIDHKATPSFFGGFSLNYTPIEKLNIYASGNFYSKQTYKTSNGTFEVDPKFTMNCKISYKVWKDNAVFVNARNAFGDKKREFAWMDETKGYYLLGFDIKF
ncbi:MAG: TonB-dependent receptor plug domain-containing protein [Salinivirgaceae bacterium]|nr:TonB-dependent receptor plug domain-containing protein [Salinivirgaceae bacterium]